MRKPAFLTSECLSRLMVSLLLCVGLLLPLMMTFGLKDGIPSALLAAAVLLAILCFVGSAKRGGLCLTILFGAAALLQLVFPGLGMLGIYFEAAKAIRLYFSGVPSAAPLFATQISLLLATLLAALSYIFSNKNTGFMPAALLIVVVLFGIWGLGTTEYLWYVLPALVALMLLISQASHDQISLFEVLPMSALVVTLGMLLTPISQVTIPPLYDAAMDLKQTISDYLFFTEPRNVFTLSSYGYYPMGSGQLGGPAEPSGYPVMIVKTDKRVLLRGVAKDEYTGRGWHDTSSANRYLYINPRWATLRANVFLEEMPPSSVRSASTLLNEYALTVQMQNTAASTVLTPVFLRDFNAQSDMIGYFNNASELFITRDLKQGDRYTVFAPVFEGGGAELGALINASPTGGDEHWQAVQSEYLKLPEHLEQKVWDDLANIVADSPAPYQKACAILRHLQRYYRYTLTPETPPKNQDFVTYFMYVGKEGYCTYFASAMTVLCRMAGLPARYVEGFLAEPATDGLAYVTGSNAHAWTEIYFEGFGWVPFDATPNQSNETKEPPINNQQPEPTPTPEPEDTPPQDDQAPEPPTADNTPEPDPDIPPETEEDPPFPWWLILLLLALAAAFCVRVAMRMPDAVAKRKTNRQDKIYVYGGACFALMQLLKRVPSPGETPALFARRMDRQKAFPVQITPLWRMLMLNAYSQRQPAQEDVERARDVFQGFYKGTTGLVKLRFMIRLVFRRGVYEALETKLEHQAPIRKYTYKLKNTVRIGRGSDMAFRRPSNQRPTQNGTANETDTADEAGVGGGIGIADEAGVADTNAYREPNVRQPYADEYPPSEPPYYDESAHDEEVYQGAPYDDYPPQDGWEEEPYTQDDTAVRQQDKSESDIYPPTNGAPQRRSRRTNH